jgi:hypothetical protein
MTGVTPDALLTRRRLGGAVLVLAGIVLAAVVLWPRGESSGRATPPQPVRLVSVPQLGLALAHPRTWKQSAERRVLRLRSPDGSALLTFSAPVAGRHSIRVKAALKTALLKRLRPAKVVRDGPARLGDRQATSFEVSGRESNGRVRALALVDSTPYRTYAVTLLTVARPSRRRLAEVQQILGTVRLTKPVLRSKK